MSAATLTPLSLAERLASIVGLLCRAVADRGPQNRTSLPLLLPAWTRLRRLCARFVAFAAAVEAGRIAGPRTRRRTEAARRPSVSPWPVRLPTRFGWLLELAPHVDTRIGRSQVEHWLADPGVTALMETAPQAGRILRPLCRMLAIDLPPALRLPKRVRRPPAAAAAAAAAAPEGLPDASPPLPSWLRVPSSPPLPGLPPTRGSRAPFAPEPDPVPD